MDIEIKFGNRIKQLRKEKHLSQERLSFKSGLHRNYICDVERGKRNISLKGIEKIAIGLEVPIEELFK